jgi:hypothetical protein
MADWRPRARLGLGCLKLATDPKLVPAGFADHAGRATAGPVRLPGTGAHPARLMVTAAIGPQQLALLFGGDCLPKGGQHRFTEDQVSSAARHAHQAVPGGVHDVGVVTRAGDWAAFPHPWTTPAINSPEG